MKKLHFATFIVLTITSGFLFSCSSGSGPNVTPADTTYSKKMIFTKDHHSQYDISQVDTADASGNNGDLILGSTRVNVQEIVVDSGLIYKGRYNVTEIVTFSTPPDTNYFYVDPSNGNLYRYNFGFSTLNQNGILLAVLGQQIDVGWVLCSKPGASVGTTWQAAYDSVAINYSGISLNVYIKSIATTKKDTSITVGLNTIKATHVQFNVTAATPTTFPYPETGSVLVDTYLAPDIGEVAIDFYHHSTLSGNLAKTQTRGSFKILTSY
jgi:hypothetical protein